MNLSGTGVVQHVFYDAAQIDALLSGLGGGSATNAPWPAAGTNMQATTNALTVTMSLTNRPAVNGQDITNAAGPNIDIVFRTATTNGHKVTLNEAAVADVTAATNSVVQKA